MHLRQPERKVQQVRKSNERFCKAKNTPVNAIPASWEMNERQRNFIESMFEDKQAS